MTVVTLDLFGGNIVRDPSGNPGLGNPSAPGPWLDAFLALGMTHWRWPGGGVTELLTEDQAVRTYCTEMLPFVETMARHGRPGSIVVPTWRLWSWPAAPQIVAAVRHVVQRFPGAVHLLESGNERYNIGFHPEGDPAPYLADTIRWLEALRDCRPVLTVQAWPASWRRNVRGYGDRTSFILDGIPGDLRPLVAGMIVHQYVGNPGSYDNGERMAGLRAMEGIPGYPGDHQRFISEWGVNATAVETAGLGNMGGVSGMEAAPMLVRGFDQLVRHNTTRACLWPTAVRYPNTNPGGRATAGWNHQGRVYLTPAGVAFRKLRDLLPGTVRIGGTVEDHVNRFDYAGPDRAVVMLTNQGHATGVTVENPARYLPAALRCEVMQVGWQQNPLIAGAEEDESGAACGVLTTAGAEGEAITVPLPVNGTAFVVATSP